MKKYVYYLILICIQFLLTSSPVFADSAQSSQRWVCLKSQICSDSASNCSGKGVLGHRVILNAREDAKPLANKDTYIVECLATNNGQVCTTGSSTLDTNIYGKDNTAALNKTDDYQFQGIFMTDGITTAVNPVKSLRNGTINPVEWQSYSKGNARKFFALNFFDPSGGNDTPGLGAQQQGTFSFETQSNLKDCVSISWDPYGRIFDSQTLEPIPNASVDLLKKTENGLFKRLTADELIGGAIENPFMTKENGYFSFVVPDGTYRLSVQLNNYVFPNDKTKLNADYSEVYSEIYPNDTGSEIIQKGSVQHRDIPLDPVTKGFTYPLKLIEYFYNLDKQTDRVLLEGLVSHPLTKIKFYSIKPSNTPQQTLMRYKLIKIIQTDKYGKFKTEVDQSRFEPTEIYGDMELEKIDFAQKSSSKNQGILTKLFSLIFRTFQIPKTEAAQSLTSSIRFNPILSALKGYAYDARKNVLPNAKVGIYFAFSNKPYCETKTDVKGYYEVLSECLPDSPYDIKYSTIIGGKQALNTSKFIVQNSSYLEKNAINLNSKKADRNIVKSSNVFKIATPSSGNMTTKNSGSLKSFPVRLESNQLEQKTPAEKQNSTKILTLLVLSAFFIAGFILLGAAIYLVIKQKKRL